MSLACPPEIRSPEVLFFDQEPGLLPLYLALREMIASLAPGCEVRVQRTQVSFRAPRPFAWVWLPPRRGIRGRPERYFLLSFAAAVRITEEPAVQCVQVRPGLYTCHAVLCAADQLDDRLRAHIAASLALRCARITPRDGPAEGTRRP